MVLPTHQRRELVRRAVGSVLAQTFTDFELIVVDDGSTDGTGEVLDGIDERLHYVWQENAGVAAARNRALALARAPLVAFLDDDNRWLPEHLAFVTDLLARHPRAVVASTCRSFLTTGRDGLGRAALFGLERGGLRFAADAGYMSCLLVRREALVAIGGLDPELGAGEDTDLVQRLAPSGPWCPCGAAPSCGTRPPEARREGVGGLPVPSRGGARRREPARRRARAAHRGAGSERRTRLSVSCTWPRRSPPSPVAKTTTRSTHLGIAADRVPPVESAYSLTARVRRDLPRSGAPATPGGVRRLADLWPRREDDAPRYLRFHALVFAVRLRRFGVAARMAAGWRGKGKVASARRLAPMLVVRMRRILQERRFRGPAGS